MTVNANIDAYPINKFLSHPFKKGELVKVHVNQEPETKINPRQFQRQFLRVIRKDAEGQWNLVYVESKKLFSNLKPQSK